MSDNPFGEAEDGDRTVIHPTRHGIAATAATAPGPVAPPAFGAPPSPPPAAAPPRAEALAGGAEAVPHVGPGPLAAAAAPLLQTLARLAQAGLAAPPDPEELRERTMRALRQFEADAAATGAGAEEIRAAHYVLCAALDDVVLATPWGAQSPWAARSLVSTFHRETRSGERVFDLLAGMMRDPGRYRGALEVAALTLSLGLRGKFRLMERGPAELDRVREGLFQLLAQLRGPFERELSPHWRGVDAPHRGPRRDVPAWVAGAAAVTLLAGGWWWLLGGLGSAAGNLAARTAALPPAVLPTIERPRPPARPAPPPPAPLPRASATPKLRQFLAPEIAQGLVTVDDDPQRVLVRIRNRGMFPSGSASVDPRFQDLLRRLGEALRDEPGRVLVLGHSDNQAIRTVRFPSNYALSQARAEEAKRLIASANGDPMRFAAEGRADSEPLVSNDAAEGREENRRIEVLLLRGAG